MDTFLNTNHTQTILFNATEDYYINNNLRKLTSNDANSTVTASSINVPLLVMTIVSSILGAGLGVGVVYGVYLCIKSCAVKSGGGGHGMMAVATSSSILHTARADLKKSYYSNEIHDNEFELIWNSDAVSSINPMIFGDS